eukprot:1160331-Pelagomonas_calceolata.AAC.3
MAGSRASGAELVLKHQDWHKSRSSVRLPMHKKAPQKNREVNCCWDYTACSSKAFHATSSRQGPGSNGEKEDNLKVTKTATATHLIAVRPFTHRCVNLHSAVR